MAFQKKTWVNRIVQYPLRRLLTMVRSDDGSGTEIVDIQREDGEITQEGDAFSAENMNDLEQRIEDAFDSVSIDVDDELDNTSENPVQNKVITQALSTVDTKATNAASAASSAQSTANTASSTANAALANQAKSIEPGTTATVAHSKDDYIIYGANKQFAEVLSNISVGTALTTGTGGNIKNLTQGEVLTELNETLAWKYLGYIQGSTSRSISDIIQNYSEIYLFGYISRDTGINHEFSGTIHTSDISLANTNVFIFGGFYNSASSNGSFGVTITSQGTLSIRWTYLDGAQLASSSTLKIYYR